jgi:hypothetical protein
MHESIAKYYLGYWFRPNSKSITEPNYDGPDDFLGILSLLGKADQVFKVVEVAHEHYRGHTARKVPDKVKAYYRASKGSRKKMRRQYVRSYKYEMDEEPWTYTRPLIELDSCTRLREDPTTGKRMKNPIKPVRKRDRVHNIDED